MSDGEIRTAQDLAIERTILWQDFTQPNGYRDTLIMVKYSEDKYSYEFRTGGTVHVIPYKHFWRRIE